MHRLWNGRTTHPAELVGFPAVDPRAQAVEDRADELLAQCVTLHGADEVNTANDLYDGLLLPQMMQAIACWTGRTDSAVTQMRELHNLLANALHKIAEGEIK
jgi:hypothetical protein